eukprot:g70838.t1
MDRSKKKKKKKKNKHAGSPVPSQDQKSLAAGGTSEPGGPAPLAKPAAAGVTTAAASTTARTVALCFDNMELPGRDQYVQCVETWPLDGPDFYAHVLQAFNLLEYVQAVSSAKMHIILISQADSTVCNIEVGDTVRDIAQGFKLILRPSTGGLNENCFLCVAQLDLPGHRNGKDLTSINPTQGGMAENTGLTTEKEPDRKGEEGEGETSALAAATEAAATAGGKLLREEKEYKEAIDALSRAAQQAGQAFQAALTELAGASHSDCTMLLQLHNSAITAARTLHQAERFHLESKLDYLSQLVHDLQAANQDEEEEEEGQEGAEGGRSEEREGEATKTRNSGEGDEDSGSEGSGAESAEEF